MFLGDIYMKINLAKTIILVIGVLGYICLGVKHMSASVTTTFIFCWTAFVLGALFAFSPEIKRLVLKKDRLELEHFRQQVDKVLVEYDEFKKTVYPLLEIALGQVDSTGYLNVGPKSGTLVDFVERTENLINSGNYDDKLFPLLEGAKAQTLSAFSNELSLIVSNLNGIPSPKNYIYDGLENDYSKDRYANKDDAYVNFEKLNNIGESIPNSSTQKRYFEKLKKLKSFYDNNY
jgi:hypothetical protein